MSNTETIGLIKALLNAIPWEAVIGFCTAYIAYKQAKISKTMNTVEKNTNSLAAQLVTKTATISHAEGVIAGRAQMKDEEKDKK
jgi:hypothetical protein